MVRKPKEDRPIKSNENREPKADAWKNRIVGHSEVDPNVLVTNEKNYRKHSTYQKSLMRDTLDTLGWVQEIIVNEQTGVMLDGHLRLELALRKKETSVPVKYVSLTPEEEDLFLLTFDPVGSFAVNDKRKLESLLRKNAKSSVKENIRAMLEAEAEAIGVMMESQTNAEGEDVTKIVKEKGSFSKNKAAFDNDVSGLAGYDGRENNTDVGVGPCKHKCLYCFTAASRASYSWKGVRPKAPGEMLKEVQRASRNTRLLEIGSANDPSMPEFINPLVEALKAAKKHKVYLVIQTKNPSYFVDIIQKENYPVDQVTIRCSLSVYLEERVELIEPGTESLKKRIEGLDKLSAMGVDCNFRLSPFILGEYDGLDDLLEKASKSCKSVSVELLRISRAAEQNYFFRINNKISPNFNIGDYFDKWGRRGSFATYGAQNWYDYDPVRIREELILWRDKVHELGMQFFLENYETTYSNCDLNDGQHPLDTEAIRKFNPKIPETLTSMVKDGTIQKLRIDYLREVRPGTLEYQRRLNQILMANDQQRPLLVERMTNGQEESK